MKKFSIFAVGLALSLFMFAPQGTQAQSYQTKWHWNEGTIELESPARPAGQKDVLNLALPAEPIVRVAFVGLGMRGPGAVERFTHINGVRIVALCDYEPSRVEASQKILQNAGLPEAASYSGYSSPAGGSSSARRGWYTPCRSCFRENQTSPATGRF